MVASVSEKMAAVAKHPRHPVRSNILEMQRLIMADIRNKKTTPAERANLVTAYDRLESRLALLRGHSTQRKPKDKPQRVKPTGAAMLPLPDVSAGS